MRTLDASKTQSIVRVRVRFGETDLMGIVHHSNYLSYMEVGRVEWLRRRNVMYGEWARGGLHLPVVELVVRYKSPTRFDEELSVETSLTEVGAASIRFAYRIVRESDRVLCADGSTRLACVDGKGTLRRITKEMEAALMRPEGSEAGA